MNTLIDVLILGLVRSYPALKDCPYSKVHELILTESIDVRKSFYSTNILTDFNLSWYIYYPCPNLCGIQRMLLCSWGNTSLTSSVSSIPYSWEMKCTNQNIPMHWLLKMGTEFIKFTLFDPFIFDLVISFPASKYIPKSIKQFSKHKQNGS